MKTLQRFCRLSMAALAILFVTVSGAAAYAATDPGSGEQVVTEEQQAGNVGDKGMVAISVALTIGISCLSAGFAVGKVGAAALGAAAEKPELMGKALIFVGLAEGIAIYGLIIALFLIGKL